MKLTARKLGPSEKYDPLVCTRDDGSTTQVSMPRQGVLPHDLLHWIVETALPFRHGFLSQVADGGSIAIDAGMSYVEGPAGNVQECWQVEALVEALQTQLWAGHFDTETFLEATRLACAVRDAPAPDLQGLDLEALLFQRARQLHEEWMRVPPQHVMTLEFERRAAVTPG